ncbi:hypothetical protein OS965_02130 [Streptomyces sp. H27-G5]|uniref:hypothetical protein n=1 Tax=Streptomyces sp. H27-G5 TaxID=2996698 RepID=UPI00226F503E|nr:hypothetical protein [Streptomyces sp. H27-G5]MCY0916973.1 hypothetical protein [Streptomyces sp. H27-G5]
MSLLDIARPGGRHRVLDRLLLVEHCLAKSAAANGELRRRLTEATAARDTANAKASQLRDAEIRAAEATQQLADRDAEIAALKAQLANVTAVSDRPARAAATETQPIPVVTSKAVWPLGEARARGLL